MEPADSDNETPTLSASNTGNKRKTGEKSPVKSSKRSKKEAKQPNTKDKKDREVTNQDNHEELAAKDKEDKELAVKKKKDKGLTEKDKEDTELSEQSNEEQPEQQEETEDLPLESDPEFVDDDKDSDFDPSQVEEMSPNTETSKKGVKHHKSISDEEDTDNEVQLIKSEDHEQDESMSKDDIKFPPLPTRRGRGRPRKSAQEKDDGSRTEYIQSNLPWTLMAVPTEDENVVQLVAVTTKLSETEFRKDLKVYLTVVC